MVVTGAGVCCSRTKCLNLMHFSLYSHVMTHKSCLNISGAIFLSPSFPKFCAVLCFPICNIFFFFLKRVPNTGVNPLTILAAQQYAQPFQYVCLYLNAQWTQNNAVGL